MDGDQTEEQLIWCPYTDQEIPLADTTPEHVVPLSLGGVNEFCVRTEKKANSDIGSKIDAPLAEEFLVKQRRNRLGMVGHSGKRPVVTWKRSELESGEPVQVTLDRGDVRIWSPVRKQYIAVGSDVQIRSKWTMYVDTRLRFAAKVALSAGYFLYGDLFRRAVAHDEVRFIMEFDRGGVTPDEKAELKRRASTMGIQAEDWLRRDDNPDLEVFRLLSQAYGNSSIVGLMPTKSSLTVFVGVLGMYVGLVAAPADTTEFPLGGTHDLGHVMALRDGKIERQSLRDALGRLYGMLRSGWRPAYGEPSSAPGDDAGGQLDNDDSPATR